MAQEVLEVMPDAVVTGDHGFYRVDYGAVFNDPAMRQALDASGYQLRLH